eukprot:CAMPEP_0177741844 /NCGR_PEP_ID=MMETSP0484_2-20121128/28326_1 /TAXON_ID=354590 /ORGANISM="Rhodomonas lens, Strain RHODO" /LENGTH=49 /DNA_ID= /DNA_START= /DNA_END= /DNA_ORIENTATION=
MGSTFLATSCRKSPMASMVGRTTNLMNATWEVGTKVVSRLHCGETLSPP